MITILKIVGVLFVLLILSGVLLMAIIPALQNRIWPGRKPEFLTNELEYIKWAVEGRKITFVSTTNDTVIYEVLYVDDNTRYNFVAGNSVNKSIILKKYAKETSHEFEFLNISKPFVPSSGKVDTILHRATVNIHFHGNNPTDYSFCPSEVSFDEKKLFLDKMIYDSHCFYHEKYPNDLPFYPIVREEIIKYSEMWWSKSLGLLSYQTEEGIIYNRIN